VSLNIATAEKNLLIATRNQLRTELSLEDNQCNVELDEAPATVGKFYYLVMPGGVSPGPTHNTSGGVFDLLYGVDVRVIVRATEVPRDRKRDVFIGNLGALADKLDAAIGVIDFRYELLSAANALIEAEVVPPAGEVQFVEPLKLASMDPKPIPVGGEMFGASGEGAGIMRTLRFHGARRITYRTVT
jgi:hypothetical protein